LTTIATELLAAVMLYGLHCDVIMTPMKNKLVVTIDGPAGSGKSTVAAALAKKLFVAYLDTGAMYRCVTLSALRSGVDLSDQHKLSELADKCHIEFRYDGQDNLVLLDGEDVSEAIRGAEVTAASHFIASAAAVRALLVDQQRRTGDSVGSLVTEGRDQGTVVFPDADFKFYLDASPQCRARRRTLQFQESDTLTDYKEILAAQKQRDRQDATRDVGPMKASDDAIVIDTTKMSIDEVVGTLYDYIDTTSK